MTLHGRDRRAKSTAHALAAAKGIFAGMNALAKFESSRAASVRHSTFTDLYLQHERFVIGTGAVLVFLLSWEWFGRSGLIDPLFISTPSRVASAGFGLVQEPDFWNDLRVSGVEFMLGYAAAVLIAIPLGLAVGLSKRVQYIFSPFIDTLNAVPRVTLLPLIIIWFGIGIWSKVVVVFLGAVIPLVITTQSGAKTSEARFLRLARSFSASRRKIFSSVILPGTVPFIFTGLKYGAGRALLGVVVGELYAATAGIGHMIGDAGNTFQVDIVFFGVAIFMAAGLLIVTMLDLCERHFAKWRPELNSGRGA
jgi:ABC-type nitrate/sulfonate/bicarbonate transport system permease component